MVLGTVSRSIVSASLMSSLIHILVQAALLFVWTSQRGKHKHTRNCCPSVCVFHADISLHVFGSITGKHCLVLLLRHQNPSSLWGEVQTGLTLGVSVVSGSQGARLSILPPELTLKFCHRTMSTTVTGLELSMLCSRVHFCRCWNDPFCSRESPSRNRTFGDARARFEVSAP